MLACCAALAFLQSPAPPSVLAPREEGRGPSLSPHGDDPIHLQVGSGLAWIRNEGQWAPSIRYVARTGRVSVAAEPDGLLLWLAGTQQDSSIVRLSFGESSTPSRIESRTRLCGTYSYFRGDDPSRWVRGTPSFAELCYLGVRPGIDLVVRGTSEGLKYDLLVAPGADLASLVIGCEGVIGMDLDAKGTLLLRTPAGPLRHAPGRTWQVQPDGTEREIACRVRLVGERSFGFELEGYDRSLPLVIDPSLLWSTFLGSATPSQPAIDAAYSVATDANGDVTLVGTAAWNDFPTTPGAYQHPGTTVLTDPYDVFVTRLRGSDGALVFSSLIGGKKRDQATAVAIDDLGRPVVGGWTFSKDFPTTPGVFDPTKEAMNESSILLRLSAAGDDLQYSTYIEGSTNVWDNFSLEALAVDLTTGSAIVAGRGIGDSLPSTAGSFQPKWLGVSDGFIARFSPDASAVEWGTFLGGSGLDEIHAIDLDEEGRVALTGETRSLNFPVTDAAFQPQIGNPNVNRTAFVTVLDPTASRLVWSSYLGGNEVGKADSGHAVQFDPQGGVIAGGETRSASFPTTLGAYQTQFVGTFGDLFLTRFSPDGSSLIYSTLVGGSDIETMFGMIIDSSGVATATGVSGSTLPTSPGAFQTSFAGVFDTFVVRLNPRGDRLLYSSYLGGGGEDWGLGIATNPIGRAFVAGYTRSPNFPTTPNALSPTFVGGDTDAFATALDPYLEGVRPFGHSTRSCTGPLRLNAWKMPVAGDASFGLYCSGAPPGANGWLLKGTVAPSPAMLHGVEVWLAQPFERIPVASDADGYVEIPQALTSALASESASFQCLFEGTPACGGTGSWSASNGITITVQ
jgi:hypothetical protein